MKGLVVFSSVMIGLCCVMMGLVVSLRHNRLRHQDLYQALSDRLSYYEGYSACAGDVQAALNQDGTNGVAKLFEQKQAEIRVFIEASKLSLR